jgi:prepilin-type N-terminal cleavage/methylation domain-containing protein
MKKVQGFTLIELLIAMSIISILSAIAAPQFKSYRQKAYDSAAISVSVNEDRYIITGRHELGTKDYVWDSEEGGF